MRSINDLQKEIEYLHRDLAKLNKRLLAVGNELADYRALQNNKISYDEIYALAESMPVIKHPVCNMQPEEKAIYVSLLLMVATVENELNDRQLLLLQRMIMSDEDWNKLDIYFANMRRFQPDNVIFHLQNKNILSYSNQLLLDMMLIAKLGKHCTSKTMNLIADIAVALDKDKNKVRKIIIVAKALLTHNLNVIETNQLDYLRIDNLYGYYFREFLNWNKRVSSYDTKEIINKLDKIMNYYKNNNMSVLDQSKLQYYVHMYKGYIDTENTYMARKTFQDIKSLIRGNTRQYAYSGVGGIYSDICELLEE